MRRRAYATLTAVACAFVVVAAAGAAGRSTSAYPDLSTRQAVSGYLRSLGVDPAGVVVQRGARNYAGPSCPGRGWTCTTSTRVLQISRGQSGNNTVECTPGTAVNGSTAQTCVITQNGPGSNTATCTERGTAPTMSQDCSITQIGTANTAAVDQTINALGQDGATVQGSTQTAEVTQAGDTNSSSISQQIHQKQNGGTGTQSQDTHQGAAVCQAATTDCATPNTGSNTSTVAQSVFAELHATAPVTQDQETTGGAGPCFVYGNADLCATVDQESSASNSSDLRQQQHLLAQANGGTVTQDQGHFDGGVAHHFSQNPAGSNAADVQQQIDYDLHAPAGSSQSQDPRASCCSTGSGVVTVQQSGKLSASENNAFQQLGLDGNVLTNGQCSLSQNAQVNSGRDSEQTQGTGSCSSSIDCTSAGEGPGGCTAGPVPEAAPAASTLTRFGPVGTLAAPWSSLLR